MKGRQERKTPGRKEGEKDRKEGGKVGWRKKKREENEEKEGRYKNTTKGKSKFK